MSKCAHRLPDIVHHAATPGNRTVVYQSGGRGVNVNLPAPTGVARFIGNIFLLHAICGFTQIGAVIGKNATRPVIVTP